MDGKHIDKLQLAKFEADQMERRRQRRTVALKTLAFMAFWAAAVFAFWLGYTGRIEAIAPKPTSDITQATDWRTVEEHGVEAQGTYLESEN